MVGRVSGRGHLARSFDNGATWSTTTEIDRTTVGVGLVWSSMANVFVGCFRYVPSTPANQPIIGVSADGVSFTPVLTAASYFDDGGCNAIKAIKLGFLPAVSTSPVATGVERFRITPDAAFVIYQTTNRALLSFDAATRSQFFNISEANAVLLYVFCE